MQSDDGDDENREREEVLHAMRSQEHSQGTKSGYVSKVVDFCIFLSRIQPNAFVGDVVADLQNAADPKKHIKECVLNCADTPVLNVGAVEDDSIAQWYATFRGKEGSTPSKSVFVTATSALGWFWRQHGAILSDTTKAKLKTLKKGAGRLRAQEKERGEVPMEEGKAALSFELYCLLAEELFTSVAKNAIFLHSFLLLSWNLMSRASTTSSVRMAHVKWENDSLIIQVARHKSDQEGQRTDPKHLYANPTKPYLCILTSLAVYWATFGAPKFEQLLFDGMQQHARFVKGLQQFIDNSARVRKAFDERGLTAEDIAAHSLRKGARSFCSGGSTNGPSYVSIMLRGGWALEGIDKHYVRFERAGDQHVGRTLSGLDPNSTVFATLPPHFRPGFNAQAAVLQCFPKAAVQLMNVLTFALASLIFNRAYFEEHLPADHPLRFTLFWTQNIGSNMEVALDFGRDEQLCATGVPPHIAIARRVEESNKRVDELPNLLKVIIHDEFEARAADTGCITRDHLQNFGQQLFERIRDELQTPAAGEREERNPDEREEQRFQTWVVDGILRRVPPGFKFPTKITTCNLFNLYCLGDPERRICPFRLLESKDFVSNKERKRLSDMRTLMRPLRRYLESVNCWREQPGVLDVSAMWERAMHVIAIPEMSDGGQGRRMREMAWTTHLNSHRKRPRFDAAIADAVPEAADE